MLPTYLLGAAASALLVAGFFWGRAHRYRKTALFFVLLLSLGPGLLGSPLVKDHWGRPRPRQVQLFGGDSRYHQIWERGEVGAGRSFPSGHVSAAFSLVAPYFLLRGRAPLRARLALIGCVCYGVAMGFARMAQGGHFLTDILWTAGAVYLVGLALYYLLRLDQGGFPRTKEPLAP